MPFYGCNEMDRMHSMVQIFRIYILMRHLKQMSVTCISVNYSSRAGQSAVLILPVGATKNTGNGVPRDSHSTSE